MLDLAWEQSLSKSRTKASSASVRSANVEPQLSSSSLFPLILWTERIQLATHMKKRFFFLFSRDDYTHAQQPP